MKIHYCLPTYKSYDLAYIGIEAAMRGTVKPDTIVVIDNSGNGAATAYLQPLVEKYSHVYIWPETYNIGVAASWNKFMHQLDGYVLIANDDIQVHEQTIEKMIQAIDSRPQEIFFCGDGYSGNAFSFFSITKRGYCLIGDFDADFYPAYYEDNDYARRMLLQGYAIQFVSGATYSHDASSTMKRYTPAEMEQHHNNFRANTQRYIAKWGGMPHQEIFETPYNR